MAHEQLRLFEESLEEKLIREVSELKESLNKVRKGQFAKIGNLQALYDEISIRLGYIESGLCEQSKAALHVQEDSGCKIYEIALM